MRSWTAIRLPTRILYSFHRRTSPHSRIAVLGARSAPKPATLTSQGRDIKGCALGWLDRGACTRLLAPARYRGCHATSPFGTIHNHE